MFKKQTLLTFFICFFGCFAMHAAVEKLERQSVTFFNCDTEIILDAKLLEEIVDLIQEFLNQQAAGSTSVNYTKSGYVLLQALQDGGYINLTIENKEKKAYLDWLIQKSATQKKSIAAIVKDVKKALGATSSAS